MKERIVAVFLLVIGVASGLCYLVFGNNVPTIAALMLKIIPTINMCLWMIMKKLTKINWPIFVGLFLSMLCDAFMLFDGSLFMIAGIASNMLALLFYTLYFVRSDKSLDAERLIPIIVVLGVFYFVLYDNLGSFKIPVLIYLLIYMIFMWRSTARLGDKTISVLSQNICFLGSIIVTTSDCLLSFLLFKIIQDENKYHYAVMLLWWAGLFLLMVTAELKRQRMLTNKKEIE